jgi:hypothetical protein
MTNEEIMTASDIASRIGIRVIAIALIVVSVAIVAKLSGF